MILVEGACMRLNKRSEYGLKAAVRLAAHHGRGFLQSREIADAERLPPKFLESVLLLLRSSHILISKVGAGGGYRLARSPDQIRVHEVIDALARAEDDSEVDAPDSPGCVALDALHKRLDEAVAGAMGTITLQELVDLSDSAPVRRL